MRMTSPLLWARRTGPGAGNFPVERDQDERIVPAEGAEPGTSAIISAGINCLGLLWVEGMHVISANLPIKSALYARMKNMDNLSNALMPMGTIEMRGLPSRRFPTGSPMRLLVPVREG